MKTPLLRRSDLIGYGKRIRKLLPQRIQSIREEIITRRTIRSIDIEDCESTQQFLESVNFTPFSHRTIALFLPFTIIFCKIPSLINQIRFSVTLRIKSLRCIICQNIYYSRKNFVDHYYKARCLAIPPILTREVSLELIYPAIANQDTRDEY